MVLALLFMISAFESRGIIGLGYSRSPFNRAVLRKMTVPTTACANPAHMLYTAAGPYNREPEANWIDKRLELG